MRTLHITNGDGAGNLLKASPVEGDVLPWRDPMHHGPFPADLDLDAITVVRSDYLAGPYLDADAVRQDGRQRNAQLRASDTYDEVIFWFEHDLLDQLQILQILDWWADHKPATRLSMVCINTFPGRDNFRGLGELMPEQIATLLPDRMPVTDAQLSVSKAGWAAFRSADPRNIEAFLQSDTRPLPFLAKALRRHLEEFPWTTHGLTRTEHQLLTLVANGVAKPGAVFVQNMEFEDALFIGDWPTFRRIAMLCEAEVALLHCTPHGRFRHQPVDNISADELTAQRLDVTDAGRDVLAGSRSAAAWLIRDEWLGGVHLKSGEPMWMWDPRLGRLVLNELS